MKLFRVLALCAVLLAGCGGSNPGSAPQASMSLAKKEPQAMTSPDPDRGRYIFRCQTFGDETFWSDRLRLHEVVGTGVSPKTALSVGLKVDVRALPPAVRQGIADGSVDLASPETTVALLKLDAVIGLKGRVETVDGRDRLKRLGVTCALCHSTVDNSFAAGIGRRLDGWPNRDLDPGAIIALSPALSGAAKAIHRSWGKGRYDPRFNLDGISAPVLIPPA